MIFRSDRELRELSRLESDCLACRDCAGHCREILDLLLIPDTVLKSGLNSGSATR